MKLYEIKDLYFRFFELVENGEIELDAYADTLEAIDGEFEDKADNIACLIKTLISEAKAIESEEKALKERRERKERQAESLKNYLSITMQQLGKSKLETTRNVLSFRKTTSLYIEDEVRFMELHPNLVNTKVEKSISKKDATEIIKAGCQLEGARLIEKQNLQIK